MPSDTQRLMSLLVGCAADHYKADDNTCHACKSAATSVGGTESACQCSTASFDGKPYNRDNGCGAAHSTGLGCFAARRKLCC
jgi:hypothetical protein